MQSARFNVMGNRIRPGILIFDLFGLWKSKVQALPDFLRARIEEIKAAALPPFEYFLGNQKLRTFAGFYPSGNQTNQRNQTRACEIEANKKFRQTNS